MQELITRSWNGFNIEFELIDGQLMANATSMCAAFGKQPKDWLKAASAKRFIEAKRTKILLTETQMVCTRHGGSGPGTWIHECLIRKLAEWLNVDFEVQCDEWVTELLRTGKVELAAPLTPEEFLVQQAQAMLEQSRRLKIIEAEQKAAREQLATVEQQVAEIAAKQTTIEEHHYTVAAWASKNKLRHTREQLNGLGRRASKLSEEQGYSVSRVYDPKYVTVGSYHIDILKQVFALPTTAVVRVPPPQPRARA